MSHGLKCHPNKEECWAAGGGGHERASASSLMECLKDSSGKSVFIFVVLFCLGVLSLRTQTDLMIFERNATVFVFNGLLD